MPLKIFLSEVEEKNKSGFVNVDGKDDVIKNTEDIYQKMLRDLR